jgi:putative DNA primase/helicase
MDDNSFRLAAQQYIERGWRVFPLKAKDKIPATTHGCKDATTDALVVAQWAQAVPTANIGVATGTGLVVVDIDAGHGGHDSLAALEAEHGKLPPTFCVNTAHGGKHYYYASIVPIANSASKLGPGIDVRGEGGYVVAPPSRLHDGGYTVAADVPVGGLPLLPGWVVERLQKKPPAKVVPISSVIPEGRRNDELFRLAASLRAKGLDATTIATVLHTENSKKCNPPLPDSEVEQIAASASGYPPGEQQFANTDLGNAERLAAANSDRLAWSEEMKTWLVYADGVWRGDTTCAAEGFAHEVARKIMAEAATIGDLDRRKECAKWGVQSEQSGRTKGMLEQAKPMLAVQVNGYSNRNRPVLDARPHLLNLANGTLDLGTFQLLPHAHDNWLTMATGISYDPGATCPRWEKFMMEVFADDRELVAYIQRAIGYSLTADTSEQCFFLLWGTGKNGKSTFLRVIQRLLGDYAATADWSTFTTSQGWTANTRGDVMRLRGKRVVVANEGQDGARLDEGLIKQLTGGDTYVGRAIYQTDAEFVPVAKIWMATNHEPKIRGGDEAIWRRVRKIPFTVQFSGTVSRRELDAQLDAEPPGIFNWALEGLRQYRAEGMPQSRAVQAATAEYRESSDTIGRFLADCYAFDSDACETPGKVEAQAIWTRWKQWRESEGEYWQPSRKEFGNRLAEATRVIGITRSPNKKYYIGLRSATDAASAEAMDALMDGPVFGGKAS